MGKNFIKGITSKGSSNISNFKKIFERDWLVCTVCVGFCPFCWANPKWWILYLVVLVISVAIITNIIGQLINRTRSAGWKITINRFYSSGPNNRNYLDLFIYQMNSRIIKIFSILMFSWWKMLVFSFQSLKLWHLTFHFCQVAHILVWSILHQTLTLVMMADTYVSFLYL